MRDAGSTVLIGLREIRDSIDGIDAAREAEQAARLRYLAAVAKLDPELAKRFSGFRHPRSHPASRSGPTSTRLPRKQAPCR